MKYETGKVDLPISHMWFTDSYQLFLSTFSLENSYIQILWKSSYCSIAFEKFWLEKLNCAFFHSFHSWKNNFSCQNFSVENNYFCETFMDGLREGERYIEIQKPRDYMYILIYGFSTAKPCARAFRDMHLV